MFWVFSCLLDDDVVGTSTMLALREALRLIGLTVLTDSKDAVSNAPEEVLEVVLDTGRAILKE